MTNLASGGPALNQYDFLVECDMDSNLQKSAVSESPIALKRLNSTFFIAWTIFMKLGTLVHHVHGYKTVPQIC